MKETLLTDIELDVQQLKCVVNSLEADSNPLLYEAAKRNIIQLKSRLDRLMENLSSSVDPQEGGDHLQGEIACFNGMINSSQLTITASIEEPAVTVNEEISIQEEEKTAFCLSEKLNYNLKNLLSLNDYFLYARELFDGNHAEMDKILNELDQKSTLNEALGYLNTIITADEENEITLSFIELLQKKFNLQV